MHCPRVEQRLGFSLLPCEGEELYLLLRSLPDLLPSSDVGGLDLNLIPLM